MENIKLCIVFLGALLVTACASILPFKEYPGKDKATIRFKGDISLVQIYSDANNCSGQLTWPKGKSVLKGALYLQPSKPQAFFIERRIENTNKNRLEVCEEYVVITPAPRKHYIMDLDYDDGNCLMSFLEASSETSSDVQIANPKHIDWKKTVFWSFSGHNCQDK